MRRSRQRSSPQVPRLQRRHAQLVAILAVGCRRAPCNPHGGPTTACWCIPNWCRRKVSSLPSPVLQTGANPSQLQRQNEFSRRAGIYAYWQLCFRLVVGYMGGWLAPLPAPQGTATTPIRVTVPRLTLLLEFTACGRPPLLDSGISRVFAYRTARPVFHTAAGSAGPSTETVAPIKAHVLERDVGLEPTWSAWKAAAQPLYQSRVAGRPYGTRTRLVALKGQ